MANKVTQFYANPRRYCKKALSIRVFLSEGKFGEKGSCLLLLLSTMSKYRWTCSQLLFEAVNIISTAVAHKFPKGVNLQVKLLFFFFLPAAASSIVFQIGTEPHLRAY